MEHTNVGLVAHVRKYVGVANYWFGTYGQTGTNTLWALKAKQYPQYYSDKRKEIMKARGDVGKPVCDCSGLIKWYLMMNREGFPPDYNSKYDISADEFYNRATEKGNIADGMPEIIGLAVQRKGHIGVYIGNGKVVEAKGFDYGIVISKLEKTNFVHWLKIPYIAYANVGATIPATPTEEEEETIPTGGGKKVNVTLTQLSKGSRGAEVLTLQILLNEKGSAMHLYADGIFGAYTTASVKDYQSKHGLVADGIVGVKTWTSLLTS